MSYLALARKWRPRRFEDVRGQQHVVRALQHALDHDRLHPAILLTGTRGVRKTTLARIIAKGLNCETGVSAQPCGICTACREINDGRFVDLLEIDAASNTGVDDIRQVIDNALYAPARGRYKVYLIDEVHMLSKSAFNALLKTLEEPPPHVKFILATTDPQKLPITVLSRCLQFNLKRLTPGLIAEVLGDILRQEGIEFELPGLAEIARAADGSMRDGLSLLDQAIVFAGGAALLRDAIEEMLGTVGRRTLIGLIEALARADAAGIQAGLLKLEESAPDYSSLLNDLAAHLQRLAVLQLLPSASDGEGDDLALAPIAAAVAPEDVQVWYQIAVLGRRDLPWAPDPRLGFEMALLRMLAFRPDGAGPPPEKEKPAEGGRTVLTPVLAAAATVAASADAAPAMPAAPAEPAIVSVAVDSMTPDDWAQQIDTMRLDGFSRQLARHCAWLGVAGDTVRLGLEPRAKHLLLEERRAAIERALAGASGRPLKLTIEAGAAEGVLHPVAADARRQTERQNAAVAAIEADPTVRQFKDSFGAVVRPGSVQPV
jgi:DNA polymerase-3 subunit gamma/tau